MSQPLFKLFGSIQKIEDNEDGTITVYGVASSGARDHADEIVAPEAMKAALPDYSKFPALREMHQPLAAGRVIDAAVDDDGITNISALVVDPLAITKVKTGVYAGFSIGGKVTKRDPADRSVITGLKLIEISLVDSPCNPDAILSMWKAETMSEFKPASADVIARAKQLAKAAGLGAAAHREYLFAAKDELIAEHLIEKGEIEPPVETGAEAEITPPETEAEVAVDPPEVPAAEPSTETIEAAAQPDPAAEDHAGEGGAEDDEKEATVTPEANPLVAALEEAIAKGGAIIDSAAPEPTQDAASPFADLGKVAAALKGITLKRGEDAVEKGLYSVSRFADLLESFVYLQSCIQCEANYEGDGSQVPAKLAEALTQLGAIFVTMAQEEIAEMLAGMNGDEVEIDIVYVGDEFELAASIVDAVKADADLMAKAAQRVTVEHEDSTAKAARLAELEDKNEKLSKALEEAAPAVEEMTKRFGETIDVLKGQIADLTVKFDALDQTVIPPRTAGPGAARVIAKSNDSIGAEASQDGQFASMTAEQFEKAWNALPEEERGKILVKAALARPQAITAR